MQYSLTWWEFEELQHHMHERKDIWTQDEEHLELWIRYEDSVNRDAVLAMQIVPPESTSQFRMYQVLCTPLLWTPDRCEDYMVHLLSSWSSYGERLEAEKILIDEFKLPPDLAHFAAIITSHVYLVGAVTERKNLETWETIPAPIPEGREIGRWHIVSGGVVALHTCNKGFVRAILSLQSPSRLQTEFTGFLHPRGVHSHELEHRLFDLSPSPEVPDNDGNDSGDERPTDPPTGTV